MNRYSSVFRPTARWVLAFLLVVALPRTAPAPIIYQQPDLEVGLTSDYTLLSIELSYEAVGGWSNTIQFSPDLINWNVIDAVIPAADGPITLQYFFPLTTTTAFFRLGLPQVQINFAQPYLISTGGGVFYIIGQLFDPSYTVWIDGILVSSTFINGSTIQVNVGPLSAGFHDIVIRDSMNNVVATLSHGLQVTTTGRSDQESPPTTPEVNDWPEGYEFAGVPGQAMADWVHKMEAESYAYQAARERGEDVSHWDWPTEPPSEDTLGINLNGVPALIQRIKPNPPPVGLNAADSAALSRLFLGRGMDSAAAAKFSQDHPSFDDPSVIKFAQVEQFGRPTIDEGLFITNDFLNLGNSSSMPKLDPLFAVPRVNEATGELFIEYPDLVIPGRGLDLVWGRTYRSKIGLDTAMGVGWDFSYNIRAAQNGPNITVQDGQNRIDTYFLQGDGSFATDELFRRGTLAGNVFTLQFADKTNWVFKPLDGSPTSGKIDKIIDRNSNQLQFTYNPGTGQLVQIIDTLGRPFQIGYDGAGRIQAVQDFSGRTLQYQHLTSVVPGIGGIGDLVSVRSQAVTGTPIGNDFPSGKVAQFSYSTGLGGARDHNLLTARDGLGLPWFQAIYTTTPVVNDPLYDRVASEIIGTAGESKVFTYLAKTPTPANRFNTTKTIVNDAVGNVHESIFDGKNRVIDLRQFTGRSTPGVAVTESTNRPINPVRPSDPPFFRTTVEWNRDSLPTRMTFPRGNGVEMVYQRDFDPATNPRERANLRVHRQLPVSGPALVRRFEHLIDFGTPEMPKKKYELVEVYPTPRPRGGDFSSSAGLQPEEIRLAPSRADVSSRVLTGGSTYFSFGCGPRQTVDTGESFSFWTVSTDARGFSRTCARDGNGNATSVTRPDGVTTDIEHNANGQLTAIVRPQNNTGHRERDEWHYYSSGAQNGYLQSFIRDAGGLNLTTGFTHNSVGCVTQIVDPRGNDAQFFVNQLNQVVQITSRNAALSGPPIRFLTNIFRDANNRITSIDVQNKDEFGVVGANAFFTTSFGYDSLDHVTSMTREVDSGHTVTTQYFYNAIRDLTEVRSPLAVTAVQPDARVQFAYDERRLPFTRIAAPGSPNATGSTYSYDENGNLNEVATGAPGGPQHTATYEVDDWDFITERFSAVGTHLQLVRNANHQVTSFTVQGTFLDAGGNPTFGTLRSGTFVYNSIGLVTQKIDNWFDRITGAPLGDGARTTSIGRDPALNVTGVTDDNGHATSSSYDNANRLGRVTDAKGNHVDYGYDANGNLQTWTRTDKSDTAAPDQVFTVTNVHDGRDRLITSTDNVGNANSYLYDSRSDRVRHIDPRNNLTQSSFDGLNRPTRRGRDMNANNSGFDPNDIVTAYTWDDNSRFAGRTNPNNYSTQNVYDALGRLTSRNNPDATLKTWSYDAWGNAIQSNDENGTICINNYDNNNRLKQRQITPGAGVSNATTFELFDYPGDYRWSERAINNAAAVRYTRDSLGRVLSETLNNRTTNYTHDGVGNLLTRQSPGGRTVTYAYEMANLCTMLSLTATSDGDTLGTIATYSHIGRRIESVAHRNTTSTLYTYDGFVGAPVSSDLGWGKLAASVTTGPGSSVIDQRTFTYDAAQNLSERLDTRTGGPQLLHHYDYDAANRNVHTQVNAPGPTLVRDTIYNYDLNGNRIVVNGFNTPDPGVYNQDPATPSPADAQMNQYTSTPRGNYLYDENGNRINLNGGGANTNYKYDYANRLVDLTNVNTGLRIANYQYDARGRRITTILDPDGTGTTIEYVYGGRRVLEERDGGGAVTAVLVWGQPGQNQNLDQLLVQGSLGPGDEDCDDSNNTCNIENGRGESCDDNCNGTDASYTMGARCTGDCETCSIAPVEMRRAGNNFRPGPNDAGIYCSQPPLVEMRRGGTNFAYHAEVVPWLWLMTNSSGGAAERYDYEDFGDPHIFDGSGAPLPSTAIGNPYLFKGMRFDSESGLYLTLSGSAGGNNSVPWQMFNQLVTNFDPKIGASLQRESNHAVNAWSMDVKVDGENVSRHLY